MACVPSSSSIRSLAVALFATQLAACGGDDDATPPDTLPPAAVQLAFTVPIEGVVALTWSSPGDDGPYGTAAQYDLRYSSQPLDGAGWDSATIADSLPAPRVAGTAESYTFSGLGNATWRFALRSADEVSNWSGLSNVVTVTFSDTVPPARVTDLRAAAVTRESVTLAWTAPGEDGSVGRAHEYDLRYALTTITDKTWDDAIPVLGVPAPAQAGASETFTLGGLERDVTHYFALDATDAESNSSALSNVAVATTAALRRITDGPGSGRAYEPSWSPDGKTLAFVADWVDLRHVYLVPSAGGNPARLVSHTGREYSASWSPGGDRIVFVAEPVFDNPRELWTVRSTSGSVPTRLVRHTPERNLKDCAWSPDGTRIAYVAYTTPPPGFDSDLYMVSVDGDSITALITDPDPGLGHPSWSPDGARLAFSSQRSGNGEIWVLTVDTGELVQLTNDPGYDGSPTWSPKGDHIAFSSERTGAFEIWTMSPTGGNLTQVTFDGFSAFDLAWSPDGTQLAFARSQDGGSDIWVLELE